MTVGFSCLWFSDIWILIQLADMFDKELRNIELIVQERLAVEGIAPEESDVMTKIQDILYATIEGFEVCFLLALSKDDAG